MMVAFDSRTERQDVLGAVLHRYDLTTRPQEVDRDWNPDYNRLLRELEGLAGHPVVLNTSFDLHGYPIVYQPEDAFHVFYESALPHLAIGNFLVSKR